MLREQWGGDIHGEDAKLPSSALSKEDISILSVASNNGVLKRRMVGTSTFWSQQFF